MLHEGSIGGVVGDVAERGEANEQRDRRDHRGFRQANNPHFDPTSSPAAPVPWPAIPPNRFGRELGDLDNLRLHQFALDRHFQALTFGQRRQVGACVVGRAVDALQLDLVSIRVAFRRREEGRL
jgi:hypothetical protein